MKNKYQFLIALLLFLSVNMLFVLKYAQRVFSIDITLLLTLGYALSIILFLWFLNRFKLAKRLSLKVLIIFVLSTVVLLAVGQQMIDPYQLQVDRWSAIHNFIDNLIHGVYPYGAQTHLGGYGSPFPVWQLFHIPFYLLGNVGWSFIVATLMFIHAVYKQFGKQIAVCVFVLLIVSPAFLYEVMVRSDLITNFLLVCSIICYMLHYQFSFKQQWMKVAIICGLMMSTRLTAILPFAVFFFYDYIRSKSSVIVCFPIVVIAVFAITFVPFLLWDGQMLLFFEYNPFILQSRQGHLVDFLIFIPFAIWLSLSWKENISRYFFNSALLLLLFVLVTFIHNMYNNNNWNELFDSAYDITYFNMSLPFLIIALSSNAK